MSRRRHLVCYDIANPKRLRKVHELVQAFGYPLQYSVFVCDLSKSELIDLRFGLREIIHDREDEIAFIDLGEASGRGTECFSFMGVHPSLPTQGSRII